MSSKQVINLTTSEIETQNKRKRQYERLATLKSTRNQANQRSRSIITKFKQYEFEAKLEILQQLKSKYESLKQDRIRQLEMQLEVAEVGKAYEEANQVEFEFNRENLELLEKFKVMRRKEKERFNKAIDFVRQDKEVSDDTCKNDHGRSCNVRKIERHGIAIGVNKTPSEELKQKNTTHRHHGSQSISQPQLFKYDTRDKIRLVSKEKDIEYVELKRKEFDDEFQMLKRSREKVHITLNKR